MSSNPKLVLTRRIAAPPKRVFHACSDPAMLARWLGPHDFTATEVDADFRVGGRFAFRMVGTPGTFAAEGVYREIMPDRRIVLTWRWTEGSEDQPPDGITSLLTLEFGAADEGTLLTLTHEQLPDQHQAEEHRQGWSEALDKLERSFDIGEHT